MRNTRLPLIAAAAIAVVALFLLLRPDDPEPAAEELLRDVTGATLELEAVAERIRESVR